MKKLKNINVSHKVQLLLLSMGFIELIPTNSYYAPYLILALIGSYCILFNEKKVNNTSFNLLSIESCFSIVLSVLITISNHSLKDNGINVNVRYLLILTGVYLTFYNLFVFLKYEFNKFIWKYEIRNGKNEIKIFFIFVTLMSIINIFVLFQSKYPGILTNDSISQVNQSFGVLPYSNHHPIVHTMIIKNILNVGMILFNDINKAVALYSVISILMLSAAFGFAIFTLYQIGLKRNLLIITSMLIIFMPYNIVYSFTMWKDVYFGISVLFFIVFFFRIKISMGNNIINFIGIFISGMGVALFRSNGYLTFILFIVSYFFVFRKEINKKFLCLILAIFTVVSIIKGPILSTLNIKKPDIIESLSIPAQQIARDYIENKDFSENDKILLESIIDIDKISDSYKIFISDPIKTLVREKGNQNLLKERGIEFISLYFRRMISHPKTYLKAWVDQTRGYYNSGYNYVRWGTNISKNEFGIENKINSEKINYYFEAYLRTFEKSNFLQIFISIGFYNWIVVILLFTSIVRKDKIGILLSSLLIYNIITLLIATPVFAEFRYNYAIFTSLPFLVFVVFRPRNIKKERTNG